MAATMEELIRALRFGKDAVVGAGENALSMGSGLAGQAIGGVNAMVPWMKGDLDEANRRLQEGEETFTYQPRTDVGRQMQHALGSRMEPIQHATQWAGENTADLTGSPMAGALVAGSLEAAQNFLPGMEGEGAAAKAGTRAALRKPKIAPRYYSAVEAALEQPNARKVTRPEVWKNWLLKQREVRPEELKHRGLDTLLDPEYGSNPNRLITREEIQQHLKDNPANISEETLYDVADLDVLREKAAKKQAVAPPSKTAHPLDLPETQWGGIIEDRLQVEPGENRVTVKDPVTGFSRDFSGPELTMGEDEMRRAVRRDLFATESGYDQPGGGGLTSGRRFEDEQIFPRTPEEPGPNTPDFPPSVYESYVTEPSRARKTPGGYKEILFKHPAAEPYQQKHYGSDKSQGLIGALRATEREITLPGEKKARPSFHAEEYQSDLHQAGQAKGYDEPRPPHIQKQLDEAHATAVRNHDYASDKYSEVSTKIDDLMQREMDKGRDSYEIRNDPEYQALRKEQRDWDRKTQEASSKLEEARDAKQPGTTPTAPWRDDRWLKQMVRRALRGAAEEGKDVFSWTPSGEQVTRWSDRYRKAYQNVYDKKARAYTEGELSNLMNEPVRAVEADMRKPPRPKAGGPAPGISVYSDSRNGVSGFEISYPDGTTEFYPGGPGRNRTTAKTYGAQKFHKESPAVKAWALRLTPEMRKKLLERSIPYFGVAAGLEALDAPEQ